MSKPDLEKRVAALEEALARGLYGGTAEEAMEKWNAEHLKEEEPPAKPIPIHANTTLHKTKK